MKIPNWILFFTRPVPATLGLAASIAGIIGANYDFETASISTAVIEAPTDEQLHRFMDFTRSAGASVIDPDGDVEAQLFALMQDEKYASTYLSYTVMILNRSDMAANDTRIRIAGYSDGDLVFSDFLHGEHDLPAKNGEFSAVIPVTDALRDIDEFAFCLSYRGRYYVNSVVATSRLTPSPAPRAAGMPDSGLRVWEGIIAREKNNFVLGPPCTNWPNQA